MNLPIRYPRICVALLAMIAALPLARAELIHRYSFKDGAKDSVGKVDAETKGAGATIADGKLLLKNDVYAPSEKISHLAFSASVLPKDGKTVSLVVWFNVKDASGFERVINFGTSDGGEGMNFIYFAPRTGDGSARAAITGSDVSSKTSVDVDALDDGKPHMVAIVIDGTAKKLRLFVDGKEPTPGENLGDNTLDKVKALENWLGKSSFTNDPGLNGSIDELRVYDHALTAEEAVALAKAGPDALPAAATTAADTKPAAPAPKAP